MKILTTYLIIVLSLFSSIKAQNTFYTFLDGWFGVGVVEIGDSIKTVSNYQEYYNNVAWLKINTVDNDGNIQHVWDTQNDSTDFEDATGYYSADFTDTNRWFVSNCYYNNFNTYYRHLIRFSNNLDSIDVSAKIPSFNNGIDGEILTIKYINNSTILLIENIDTPNQSKGLRFISVTNAGAVNWHHVITPTQWSEDFDCVEIKIASDGGYFLSCTETPQINGLPDVNMYYLLIKTDSYGVVQWKKRIYSKDHTSVGGAIIEKDSISYFVTWAERWLIHSSSSLIGPGEGLDSACVWIGEIDLDGNFKWKKNLYNTAINCDTLGVNTLYTPYNILGLQDSNYLVCVDNEISKAVYIKITPNGEVIWNRNIEILKEENADALNSGTPYLSIVNTIESSDGGFLGIGRYFSPPSTMFPNAIHSSVLIKLDKYGCLEPGCHLEGCTDIEALNYNPDAVYDCGCEYEMCPGSNKITIDVRHYKDLTLLDLELYKESNKTENLIELKGALLNNYNSERFKASACLPYDCEEDYVLHINYHRTIPPNSVLPFASSDKYSLGYYAYFHVYINDSLSFDLGADIFANKDTTIHLKFCKPDTINHIQNYKIYPNPIQDNLTIEIPEEIDFQNPVNFRLVDLAGRIVLDKQILYNRESLSTQELADGVYTAIIFQNETSIYTQKIIKL